jgi:hypothetical protein
MKKLLSYFLFTLPVLAYGQIGEKFEAGFIIDKFGTRYDGFLRLEPGDAKNPGELLFKETKKSKKETYGPEYLTAFKIEADSFTVLKNIPLPNKKTIKADFAKVLLVGSGGVLYFQEYLKSRSIGHAAADYNVSEENSRYLVTINGNLTVLTQTNFKDLASVVADFEDLKARIQNRKVKFSDLPKVVEEYKTFTSQKVSTQK